VCIAIASPAPMPPGCALLRTVARKPKHDGRQLVPEEHAVLYTGSVG